MKALFFLLFMQNTLLAQTISDEFSKFGLQIDNDYSYSISPVISQKPFTQKVLLRDKGLFTNYNSFLEYLNAKKPNMFKNPILMHHSGSLQFASFEEPRVLLFGNSAVLSFSENSKNIEKKVEMLEYNETEARFIATEILFQRNAPPEIKTNPKSCTACHGEPLKPIWSPYDFWPKAYNSLNLGTASQEEASKLNTFLNLPKKGVYKFIDAKVTSSKFARPNETLTQYLFSMNTHRVMRALKEKASIKPFKYLIAATLSKCTIKNRFNNNQEIPIKDFFPEQIWNEFSQAEKKLNYFTQEGKDERKRFINFVQNRYLGLFPLTDPKTFEISRRLDSFVEPTDHARYVLSRLGFQWRSWAMSYGENDFDMSTPVNAMVDLVTYLTIFDRDMFTELSPKVSTFDGTTYPYSYIRFNCDQLRTKSLESLSKLKQFNFSDISEKGPLHGLSPMAKCVKCHAPSSNFSALAPKIPFDDSLALKTWLNKNQNFSKTSTLIKSGAMPKKSILTDAEKEALILSLEKIMN